MADIKELPGGESAWTCPYCGDGLLMENPQLDEMEDAVAAHACPAEPPVEKTEGSELFPVVSDASFVLPESADPFAPVEETKDDEPFK